MSLKLTLLDELSNAKVAVRAWQLWVDTGLGATRLNATVRLDIETDFMTAEVEAELVDSLATIELSGPQPLDGGY